MSNLAVTIWKDWYKVWTKGDAYYASNDPDWVMNIDIDKLLEGTE